MRIRLVGGLFASAAICVAGSACTLASPTHIDVQPDNSADTDTSTPKPAGSSSSAAAPAAPGGSCAGSFAKVSPTGAACGNGKGHCYDKTKVPQSSFFTACPDPSTVCVEDSILQAGGGKLKSCTSVVGAGGCIDLSILNVPDSQKQQAAALTQDVCDQGDICVPCTDPTNNNAPTPFCQPIGVFDKPCTDGSAASTTAPAAQPPAQGCCTTNGKSNGICVASSAIPADEQSNTIKDTCTGNNQCVPASLASGKPETCNAGLLGNGICIDKCFSSMMGLASSFGLLSGDGCGPTEACIPCFAASLGSGGSTPIPGCN